MRAIVFLDWQNVYKRARETFHDPDDADYTLGQVSPSAVALELVRRSGLQDPCADGSDLQLEEVRVYRGQPNQQYDAGAYGAYRRQVAAWSRANNKVEVISRVLTGYTRTVTRPGVSYTSQSNIREKGVDVALAIDLVTLAIDGHYDRAIVFSGDHDLAPALEYVMKWAQANEKPLPIVQVAAWKPDDENGRRLNVRRPLKVWCHWLDRSAYDAVKDRRNYKEPAPLSQRPTPGP